MLKMFADPYQSRQFLIILIMAMKTAQADSCLQIHINDIIEPWHVISNNVAF